VRDPLLSFLRARLTTGQLPVLDLHGPVRLEFWVELYDGAANTWGMLQHVHIEVCASCSPNLTRQQHRHEWIPPFSDEFLRVIPAWVERWPCRRLLAVAAAFPDGAEWRSLLRSRDAVVDDVPDHRRRE
jgi:hypothetical protein